MEKGKIIVIEGACDGIGKTTQFEMASARLCEDGISVTRHHFPSYGECQGVLVENYLRGEYGAPEELSPYFVNNLYAADRSITWHTELKRHYEAGDVILLDRYTTSSLLYQSALLHTDGEKKEFVKFIEDFEYKRLEIGRPDLVVFLKAPFETAKDLMRGRSSNGGVERDVHESDSSYMRRVYDNSLFISSYLNWTEIECTDGTGRMKPRGVIHDDVYSAVLSVL